MPHIIAYGSILREAITHLDEDMNFSYHGNLKMKLLDVRNVKGFLRGRGMFGSEILFLNNSPTSELVALINLGYKDFFELNEFEMSAGYYLEKIYLAREREIFYFWITKHLHFMSNEEKKEIIQMNADQQKRSFEWALKYASPTFLETFSNRLV